MVPGTVFQLVGQSFHRWVIVSVEREGRVLALNITDREWTPDSPCLIEQHEHPSLSKPSAIYYKKARTFIADEVRKELALQRSVRLLAPCPPNLLARIISGAFASDEFTASLLKFLQ